MNTVLSGTMLWLFLLCMVVPSGLRAQTLPLLRDLTVTPEAAWWVDDVVPADGLDAMIEDVGDPRWLPAADARASSPISRLLRQPDITTANAIALAELFGAQSVLVGVVYQTEQGELDLLDLSRCELGIQATLMNVDSGATMATLEFATSAYHQDMVTACHEARALLLRWVTDYLPGTSDRRVGLPAEYATIHVSSPDGAAPYVALRDFIRRTHPQVRDLVERWATEGAIAVALLAHEGESALELLEAISGSVGRADVVDVTGISLRGNVLALTVREASAE